MNVYHEYGNEEDSYIGYNRFLLQQIKSKQHAEKKQFFILPSNSAQFTLQLSDFKLLG